MTKKKYSPAKTEESGNRPIELKKQLGLSNGVGIIVGVIIGSGIFVSPYGVLQSVGSVGLSLIVWLLCGLLSMVGALCYAELGTMIPKSGGEFAYLHESFGPLCAFLYLWLALLVIMPTGNAIIAITFAEYILQPFFLTCPPPYIATRLLAACVVLFLTFINCHNVKWAIKIQDSFAFAKLVALIIIILTGVAHLCLGNVQNFSRPFEDTTRSVGDVAVAFYSGMFSFSGWNALNFVTEELKDSNRNLPRAIYISLPIVTLVYLLTNVAYFAVLTRYEILTATTVAGTFGDKILGFMAWIIPVFVAMSTFGGLNGGIFACSRLFFVGARQGHLPAAVSMINVDHLTPSPSLIFLCIVTLVYLCADHIFFLINLTSFIEALVITMTIAGMMWMRYKLPNAKRPIKVNIAFPIVFYVIGVLLVTFPFYERPVETGIGLAIALAGIPVYLIFVQWKRKPAYIRGFSDSITGLVQKILVCSPQDERCVSDDESDVTSMNTVESPFRKVI